MKPAVVLTCIFLIALLVLPAMAAEEPVTQEIIRGVTLDPVPETTREVTQIVTLEPTTERTTREITPEPTTERPTHVVTETTERPVTKPTEMTVTITEPPQPQVGWLTIISTPSGAEVSIDGSAAGATPITGREVGAGSHSIHISMTGYQTYQTSKSISAGEQAAVDAVLSEIPVTTVPTTRETTIPITSITGTPCLGCDKGWIRVYCNVNGATVSFDDLSGGCTISGGSCDYEVTTTIMPFRTFTVQKPGYQIFKGPVTSWPAKDQTVNLYATLIPTPPAPGYGNIQVVSHPSGAVVTLDGGSWQYTPATFSSVQAGTSHNLQITLSGYQPYGTSAFVNAGQTATVNAYLVPDQPYPRTGSINIITSPKGADIYVDGNYIAESPYVVTNLVQGSHTLRLHKAGYDEYLSTFSVNAGQQTSFAYTFSSQRSTVGSIEVASTPSGSSVYLDGNYLGQTPYNSYFDITSVLQGTHTILVRQQDYKDYTQTLYVKGGEVVTVNAVLTPNAPSPVPDTTGQILVVSTPSGAELFLDNTFRGVTPATLADIPAGSHVVMVRQAGYTDATQTVTVTGGQSTPVALALTALPVTTVTPLTVVPVLGALTMVLMAFALGRRKE